MRGALIPTLARWPPLAPLKRGLAALAALVPADDALFTMEALPHPAPPAIAIRRHAALQMVAEGSIPAPSEDRDLLRLGPADASDMLALARLTEPGPFGMRTGELGQYWGIRDDGRLIAMEASGCACRAGPRSAACAPIPIFAGRVMHGC